MNPSAMSLNSKRCNPQSLPKKQSPSSQLRALYSFTDARRIARNYQFDSKDEFIEYSCPGAYQLPKNPEEVWAAEWKGWDDFLGVRLDFEMGRKTARALKMNSKEDYMQLIASKLIEDNEDASRLSYQPDKIYKNEWTSWDDWLGVEAER